MGGGLIQLTNTGGQDIYLTGNPQITYFKIVYRRHTNFAMESIEQVNTGIIGPGSEAIFNILRNGDLMHKCTVEIPINGSMINSNSPNNLGTAIFENISIDIGGQRIDNHPGSYLEIYSELNEPINDLVLPHNPANGSLTIFNGEYQYLSCSGGVRNASDTFYGEKDANYTWINYVRDRQNIYIPLRFWFCNDVGLSLPLIALQYSEIYINMNFTNLVDQSDIFTQLKNLKLYVDYIFLDTDERRRFAQVSHEYLIDTIQFNNIQNNSNINSYNLDMNNPVKEIIWCGAENDISLWGLNGSFTNLSDITTKWNIKLNNNDRMSLRNIDYYTNYQPYIYHTNRGAMLDVNGSDSNAIAVYSFALKPEEHQPSGTCNFSLIDRVTLFKDTINAKPKNIYVFAVTYNILRIMSGIAGLAYNN